MTVLLASFVACVATTPVAARLARSLGMLDVPGRLKPQDEAVPYLGGLAVFAAVAVGVGWSRPALLWPLGLALGLGLADDRWGLPPTTRLVCALGVGAVAAAIVPTGIPGPLGPVAVALAVVVLLNAVNLIDGLDGLASGVGVASAAGFAAVLDGDGRLLAVALVGALAGFLVHNRPPARIYLGDAGAYLVGTALALLLALAWSEGRSSSTGVAALVLVGVPVGEMVVAVVRRWRARRPLFEGDRGHIYDQLIDRGRSTPFTTGVCTAVQAGLAIAAAAAAGAPLAGALAVVAAAVLAAVALVVAGGFIGSREALGP